MRIRLLIAFTTFAVSLGLVKVLNLMVEWSYPVAEIQSVNVPSLDARESNEIYNIVLRTFKDAHSKLLVVQSESEGYVYIDYNDMAPPSDPQEKFAKAVKTILPDAETETLNNYLDVNKVNGPLKFSAPDLNVALIPPPDFSNSYSWETFYKNYPNNGGLIFFSQVGFNNNHDQAMVYVSRACGGLCGGGGYILLGKTNGKWTIIKDEVLFIA